MELEVEDAGYFGKPVTGINLDMSQVYRDIVRNPENLKPVASADSPQEPVENQQKDSASTDSL